MLLNYYTIISDRKDNDLDHYNDIDRLMLDSYKMIVIEYKIFVE